MSDVNELLKMIKKGAVDAVEATKPVNMCYGKVTSASPLQINVEQKMTLGEKQLTLTRNVTDFKTRTRAEGEDDYTEITVKNGLAVGDEVILLRQQGGQKFVVLDRVAT